MKKTQTSPAKFTAKSQGVPAKSKAVNGMAQATARSSSLSTTCSIDGRGKRLQHSANELISDATTTLTNLAFDEQHEGMVLSGEAKVEFTNSLNQKSRELALA